MHSWDINFFSIISFPGSRWYSVYLNISQGLMKRIAAEKRVTMNRINVATKLLQLININRKTYKQLMTVIVIERIIELSVLAFCHYWLEINAVCY